VPNTGARYILAAWAAKSRARNLFTALPQRNCLIVINYHRIGIAGTSPYDTNVFSATPAEFDEQIAFLKKHLGIVTLAEAIAFARGETSWRGAAALLTFDDGYVDAYDTAFPILRSHGVQGTFFLPTSFIGTQRVPWWDAIAYQVFATRQKTLRLRYPKTIDLRLDASRTVFSNSVIRCISIPRLTRIGFYPPLMKRRVSRLHLQPPAAYL